MTSETSTDADTWTEAVPLTVAQQKLVVHWVIQGASFAKACEKAQASVESACISFETDARFRNRLDRASGLLADNVRAARYLAAMKGTVAAQTALLREDAAKRNDARPARGKKLERATPEELEAELERMLKLLKPYDQENTPR